MKVLPVLVGAVVGLAGACTSGSSQTRSAPPAAAPSPAPAPPSPVPAAPRGNPQELLQKARAALEAGDHANARQYASAAISADPRVAGEAGLITAESHLQDDGNLSAAESALQPGLTLRDARAVALLARVREVQGQTGEARTLLESLLIPNEGQAWVHEKLAGLALTQGAQAAATNDRAAGREAFTRAITHFQRARALSGDLPAYAIGESRAHEALGDTGAAEADLRRLLTLLPDTPGPHLHLAAFYERHGQRDRAAQERKAAGDAAPQKGRRLRPLQPSAR